MTDPGATSQLMAAYYAAITSVSEGHAEEVEIEHRISEENGREETLCVTIRRKVKHYSLSTGDDDA